MFSFSTVNIKDEAKQKIKDNYWPTVGVGVLLAFANGTFSTNASRSASNEIDSTNVVSTVESVSGVQVLTFLAISIVIFAIVLLLIAAIRALLFGPLEVGCRSWFLHKLDGTEGGQVQKAYSKEYYRRNVKTMFLVHIRVALWTLVFLIPGLIAAYRYYFVPYLLEDHPDLEPKEILELSKGLTDGHKWDIFKFNLSFALWVLLAVFTAQLAGVFFVNPYMYMAQTILYDEMCEMKTLEENGIF